MDFDPSDSEVYFQVCDIVAKACHEINDESLWEFEDQTYGGVIPSGMTKVEVRIGYWLSTGHKIHIAKRGVEVLGFHVYARLVDGLGISRMFYVEPESRQFMTAKALIDASKMSRFIFQLRKQKLPQIKYHKKSSVKFLFEDELMSTWIVEYSKTRGAKWG